MERYNVMSSMNLPPTPSLQDVWDAVRRIRPWIAPSPLMPSSSLSSGQREVRLKLESLCPSGSFKVRGAANALHKVKKTLPGVGVVTQSSGNHGRALAYMARRLGLDATVCLSTLVPEIKRRAIEKMGARVVVEGKSQDQSLEVALALAEEEGLHFVPAFDHPDIICGQGTLAVELLQQWPEVDTILVPLSGGGLASGVAIAAKEIKPDVQILGMTVHHGAAMADSLEAGRIIEVGEQPSHADALPGGIPVDNRYTFRICQRLLDGWIRVSETQIADAMVHALMEERVVLEGAGAIGLAPFLDDAPSEPLIKGANIAIICSGSYVPMDQLLALAQERA